MYICNSFRALIVPWKFHLAIGEIHEWIVISSSKLSTVLLVYPLKIMLLPLLHVLDLLDSMCLSTSGFIFWCILQPIFQSLRVPVFNLFLIFYVAISVFMLTPLPMIVLISELSRVMRYYLLYADTKPPSWIHFWSRPHSNWAKCCFTRLGWWFMLNHAVVHSQLDFISPFAL